VTVSEYRALRGLASQWRGSWRSAKAARDLEAALGDLEAQAGGPDLLGADVHGGNLLELREAAIAEGLALYGEGARLMIEHVGKVRTASPSRRGRFTARALVRCLNYAEVTS
jgi:hypothetical protein